MKTKSPQPSSKEAKSKRVSDGALRGHRAAAPAAEPLPAGPVPGYVPARTWDEVARQAAEQGLPVSTYVAMCKFEQEDSNRPATPEGRAARREDAERTRLWNLFMQTPDMIARSRVIEPVNDAICANKFHSKQISISVPEPFLKMIEHNNRARAAVLGYELETVEQSIEQLVFNKCSVDLNLHVTAPMEFDHNQTLWNRFCDANGAPGLKLTQNQTESDEGVDKGPF